jgi:predicted site-specific integrase-resolvase
MTALETDRLIDEREAADILGVKPQTLSLWRLRGQGPAFYKVGRRVRYRTPELAAYLESRRCRNTAEADALS